MHAFRYGAFVLAIALTPVLFTNFLHAQELASNRAGLNLSLDDTSLKGTYGIYSETEIALNPAVENERVHWAVLQNSLPPGFELEDSSSSHVLIFGSPQFQGQWCLVLTAKTDSGLSGARELCFVAEDNSELQYPKFQSDRFLKVAIQNQFFQEYIDLDRSSTTQIQGSVFYQPEGIEVIPRDSEFRFLIKGRYENPGAVQFALKIQNELGISTYKQFQITVVENQPSDGAKCPAGYYFDANLGYCVQSNLSRCPDGTYYEPDAGACVQFPAPPPTMICEPGYSFDHYLSRCVRNGYPRCPINYEWDSFYNRCVRSPYTCPSGSSYDWNLRECIYVWQTSCPAGSYYDSYLNRCVRDHDWCPNGSYWDRYAGRCTAHSRYCGIGSHWDPNLDRCVSNASDHCAPGYSWDPYSGRCERRQWERSCPYGSHYSPREGRCVRDYYPHPGPTHVPGPNPYPNPRPTHVPGPNPHPNPRPTHVPAPQPQPHPTYQPGPGPGNGGGGHHPGPRPEPRPTHIPGPQPRPEPRPEPRPQPTYHPGPGPGNGHGGGHGPRPAPRPGNPRPRR